MINGYFVQTEVNLWKELVSLLEEEELRYPEEAGVNRVYVCKTSLATPKGNGVRYRTTSPFAGSGHYISNI